MASGLALATTLMAMQVADTMSARTCPYRTAEVMVPSNHGFLGIRYVFADGVAQVHSIIPGTPAEKAGIHRGDRVLSVNGDKIDSASELQERIFGSRPGSRPSITLENKGGQREIRPTLVAWPSFSYAAY